MEIINGKPYRKIPLKELTTEECIEIIACRDIEIQNLQSQLKHTENELIKENARNEKLSPGFGFLNQPLT